MSTTIAFDILARDRGASNTFDRLGDSAEKTGGRFEKAGKRIKTGTVAIATGLGVAAAAVLKFGDRASDLRETQSKVIQIFGAPSAKALSKYAKNAAITMGQTRQQALDAAATFGIFGKSAGLTGDKLVGFSSKMTTLASDMASFGNTSPEEAIEAIGAALRGEAEPIRSYGVLLDDATLRNRALKLGLIATTKEALTPQNKVLAAQSEILAQTKDQQGDFARTSGGLANQQRILRARLEDLATATGAKVLPALTSITTWANDKGIPLMGTVSDVIRDKVGGAVDVASDKLSALRDVFGNLESIDGRAVGENIAAAVGSGLGQLSSLAGKAYSALSDAFGDVDWVGLGISVGQQVPSLLLGLAAGILNFDLGGLLSGVGDHWGTILMGVLTIAFAPAKLIGKVAGLLAKIPIAGRLLSWMLTSINGVGGRIKGFGGELVGWFVGGFRSSLNKAGPGLVSRFLSTLRRIPSGVSSLKGQLASRLGDLMRSGFLSAGEAAGRGVSRVVTAVKKLPGKVKTGIGNQAKLLYNVGGDIVAGLGRGISDKAHKAVRAAKDLAGKVKNAVKGALKVLSPSRVMMEIGGFVTEGLALGILGPKTRKLETAIKKTAARVTGLKQRLSGLKGERNSFAAGMNFSSSAFGADYGQMGVSPGGMLAFQRAELVKATQVKTDVAKLVKMGLSPSLIRQMQGAGESGIAAMHALASGSKTDIAQMNSLDKATQAAYSSAGMTAGNRLYGASIKSAQNELAGARKLLAVLERLDKNTGKHEVHIHLEGKDIVYSINKYQGKQGKKK